MSAIFQVQDVIANDYWLATCLVHTFITHSLQPCFKCPLPKPCCCTICSHEQPAVSTKLKVSFTLPLVSNKMSPSIKAKWLWSPRQTALESSAYCALDHYYQLSTMNGYALPTPESGNYFHHSLLDHWITRAVDRLTTSCHKWIWCLYPFESQRPFQPIGESKSQHQCHQCRFLQSSCINIGYLRWTEHVKWTYCDLTILSSSNLIQ